MDAMVSKNLKIFSDAFNKMVESSWSDRESRLHQAVTYCLSGEGKRVRALLSMLVCESYGKDSSVAVPAGMAVEMIHAYSLAHDDLPCMDNDDWRRGRPSLHRAFDEATALLAGDAILTDAMRVLVDQDFNQACSQLTDHQKVLSLRELTRAAGGHGMVFGQDQDMYWTGKGHYSIEVLETIHRGKTGGLIGAACALGAIAAGAQESDIRRWRDFGVLVGLAFQAVDDTLDQASNTGKSLGKDAEQGKLTFLALHSREQVLELASKYTEEALKLIPSNIDSQSIREFVKTLIFRQK